MALEGVLRGLNLQLHRLGDAFQGLHLTLVEDRPRKGDVALLDRFVHAVEEMQGNVHESMLAMGDGLQAAAHPVNLYRVQHALLVCQAHSNQIMHQYVFSLATYDGIQALRQMGRERSGEWPVWVRSVKTAIEACQLPLSDFNEALLMGWCEYAERMGMSSILINNQSIGWQSGRLGTTGVPLHERVNTKE